MADEETKSHTIQPTVEVKDGVGQVFLHHEMPDPQFTFYADRIEVRDVPLGKRIVAVRCDPFSGTADVAVEFIMQSDDFEKFIHSIREIVPGLALGVPVDFKLPPMEGTPRILQSSKAFCAYVAAAVSGISIDFMSYPAIQLARMQQNARDIPQLEPIMRVETLPGRLYTLLPVEDV